MPLPTTTTTTTTTTTMTTTTSPQRNRLDDLGDVQAPCPVDSVLVAPRPQDDLGDVVCRPHPDKAISQRATVLAAMASGVSVIEALADCADTRANLAVLSVLGVEHQRDAAGVLRVQGVDARSLQCRDEVLDVGNSATTARVLTAVLSGGRSQCVVTGNASLRSRPMGWVVSPLRALGADLQYRGDAGRLPVHVEGRRLHGGLVRVRVDSAQAVSALLFAAVLADGLVVVQRRTPARDHTERLLRWTGVAVEEAGNSVTVEPGRPDAFSLVVPGDPSGAAVLAALHVAVGGHGLLRLEGVCLNERRLGFFHVLRRMGVPVHLEQQQSTGPEEVGAVVVGAGPVLHGVEVGEPTLVQSAIDELPMLAALATAAQSPTRICGAGDLRDKDTDRLTGVLRLLHAFGARAEVREDDLLVLPGPLQAPEALRLPADHRLVFAAFVLATLSRRPCRLIGVAAAGTSYPGFLADAHRWLHVTPLGARPPDLHTSIEGAQE